MLRLAGDEWGSFWGTWADPGGGNSPPVDGCGFSEPPPFLDERLSWRTASHRIRTRATRQNRAVTRSPTVGRCALAVALAGRCLVDPLGGDERPPFAPIVRDSILKPSGGQVGVIADDDLELRAQLVRNLT